MLGNKIYIGGYGAGSATWRDGKTPRSVVWNKYATDPETGEVRGFTHILPHLAYLTPVQVRHWKAKLSTTAEGPVARDRRYPHPLLAVLVCNARASR